MICAVVESQVWCYTFYRRWLKCINIYEETKSDRVVSTQVIDYERPVFLSTISFQNVSFPLSCSITPIAHSEVDKKK